MYTIFLVRIHCVRILNFKKALLGQFSAKSIDPLRLPTKLKFVFDQLSVLTHFFAGTMNFNQNERIDKVLLMVVLLLFSPIHLAPHILQHHILSPLHHFTTKFLSENLFPKPNESLILSSNPEVISRTLRIPYF